MLFFLNLVWQCSYCLPFLLLCIQIHLKKLSPELIEQNTLPSLKVFQLLVGAVINKLQHVSSKLPE